jgi:hypothetical protein
MNKVSAPTPLLNYTLKYNMLKDTIETIKQRDIRVEHEQEQDKIMKAQSTRRMDQDRTFKEHVEAIHNYESVKLSKECQEYRYLYYLGTKVDKYI